MKLLLQSLTLSSLICSIWAFPVSPDHSTTLIQRADPSLVGYLGAFFLGDKPSVYFYSSNGNNAISFKALNGGNPILVPTKGTGGVRDPSIIAGGGSEAGKKWYIIGTDLDIAKTTWDASQRTGSRGIFVWESTDLVNWTGERLATVEDSTAGMVWAPDAIWDDSQDQYLVHWASKFYSENDTAHTGAPGATKIRSAYTKDFTTFTTPVDYISYDYSIIDLNILPLGGSSYARFIKDEDLNNVFTETTTDGLHGSWTRPAGTNAIILSGVEGPASYMDNLVPGKAHLLLDFFSSDGYRPYESTNISGGIWTASNRADFPAKLRHGSVLPVDQNSYDAINTKWS